MKSKRKKKLGPKSKRGASSRKKKTKTLVVCGFFTLSDHSGRDVAVPPGGTQFTSDLASQLVCLGTSEARPID